MLYVFHHTCQYWTWKRTRNQRGQRNQVGRIAEVEIPDKRINAICHSAVGKLALLCKLLDRFYGCYKIQGENFLLLTVCSTFMAFRFWFRDKRRCRCRTFYLSFHWSR